MTSARPRGRDLKKVQLKDDSKEMSIALRAILNYSVVPVATDHDLPVAAYYDSKNMELAVNPAFSDSEAFAAIAAEVAHSRIHAKGANPNYDHEEVDLDARAFPISCAASLASSGTRRTCPVWRSCTRAGTPSSGGAPWTKSRG